MRVKTAGYAIINVENAPRGTKSQMDNRLLNEWFRRFCEVHACTFSNITTVVLFEIHLIYSILRKKYLYKIDCPAKHKSENSTQKERFQSIKRLQKASSVWLWNAEHAVIK